MISYLELSIFDFDGKKGFIEFKSVLSLGPIAKQNYLRIKRERKDIQVFKIQHTEQCTGVMIYFLLVYKGNAQ